MARIDTLANFITDIAVAIKAKTGKTDPITPANFDTEIASIQTGGGEGSKYKPRYIGFYNYTGSDLDEEISSLDTSQLTSMRYLFNNCKNVTNLIINSDTFVDTNVTDMHYLFNQMWSVEKISIPTLIGEKVTDIECIFYRVGQYTTNGTIIELPNFVATNASSTNNMFGDSGSRGKIQSVDLRSFNSIKMSHFGQFLEKQSTLKSVDMRSFVGEAVVNTAGTFLNCSSLETVNLASLAVPNMTSLFGEMFSGCTKLKHLDMRSFPFSRWTSPNTTMFTGVPASCEIIVKDDTEKAWFATHWSNLTNVKTVAEKEAE